MASRHVYVCGCISWWRRWTTIKQLTQLTVLSYGDQRKIILNAVWNKLFISFREPRCNLTFRVHLCITRFNLLHSFELWCILHSFFLFTFLVTYVSSYRLRFHYRHSPFLSFPTHTMLTTTHWWLDLRETFGLVTMFVISYFSLFCVTFVKLI